MADPVTAWGAVSTFTPSLGVLEGTATGSFTNIRTIPVQTDLYQPTLTTGDFNGDRGCMTRLRKARYSEGSTRARSA